MASRIDPESDDAVADRCERLRRAVGFQKSAAFSTFLGVSPQRWNNVETGLPLGRDLAMTVVKALPGLTLDWLYRGRPEGLSLDMARRLGEVPAPARKRTSTAP